MRLALTTPPRSQPLFSEKANPPKPLRFQERNQRRDRRLHPDVPVEEEATVDSFVRLRYRSVQKIDSQSHWVASNLLCHLGKLRISSFKNRQARSSAVM